MLVSTDLNEYGFVDGQNITMELLAIWVDHAPDFSITMPDGPMTLLCDELGPWDCTGGAVRFLSGAGAASKIKGTAVRIFQFLNPATVEIEAGVEFVGDLALYQDPMALNENWALLNFDYSLSTDSAGVFNCAAKFSESPYIGLLITTASQNINAPTGRCASLTLNSEFADSGFNITGVQTAIVNAVISDPDGKGNWHRGGDALGNFMRVRNAVFVSVADLDLTLTENYGFSSWFNANVGSVVANIISNNYGKNDQGENLANSVLDIDDLSVQTFTLLIGKIDTAINQGARSYNVSVNNPNNGGANVYGFFAEASPGPTNDVHLNIDAPDCIVNMYVVNDEGNTECAGHSVAGRCKKLTAGPGCVLDGVVCETVDIAPDHNGGGFVPVVMRNMGSYNGADINISNADYVYSMDYQNSGFTGKIVLENSANWINQNGY